MSEWTRRLCRNDDELHHVVPAAAARNLNNGSMSLHDLMNAFIKSADITCLSERLAPPVKLLRLMSSMNGWLGSKPAGGLLSESPCSLTFDATFFHSAGFSTMR